MKTIPKRNLYEILAADLWIAVTMSAKGEGRLTSEVQIRQLADAIEKIVKTLVAKAANESPEMDRLKASLSASEATNARLRESISSTNDKLYAIQQVNETLRKQASEKQRTRELREKEKSELKDSTSRLTVANNDLLLSEAKVSRLLGENGNLLLKNDALQNNLDASLAECRRLKDKYRRRAVSDMPTREQLAVETMASHPDILR